MRTAGVIIAVLAWLLLRRIGKTLRTDPFTNAVFDSSNSGCVFVSICWALLIGGIALAIFGD